MNVRRHPAPMRRLHNSLVALAVVAVVSAAGFAAIRPVPSPAGDAAHAVGLADEILSADDGGTDTSGIPAGGHEAAADAGPRKLRKPPRRMRQGLAMPYFSFARS